MADGAVAKRLRSIWHFISTAPLTFIWLLVLYVTTRIQHEVHGRALKTLLLHHSTNIRQLGRDPLEVLFSSLLYIDGKFWAPYLLLFALFLAPAEHWLGQLRWLMVGLTAHILATYISEGLLELAIDTRNAPQKLVHATDIGVSYFLVGVIAVLSYHIARPWRWGYLGILFLIFGYPLLKMDIGHLDFTAIGHFSSILIGLCFYPMARTRGQPWNPAEVRESFRKKHAAAGEHGQSELPAAE